MKTIKLLIFTVVIATGMVSSVYASWWNPLTWRIFSKKIEHIPQRIMVSTTTVNNQDGFESNAILENKKPAEPTQQTKNSLLTITKKQEEEYKKLLADRKAKKDSLEAEIIKNTMNASTTKEEPKKMEVKDTSTTTQVEVHSYDEIRPVDFTIDYTLYGSQVLVSFDAPVYYYGNAPTNDNLKCYQGVTQLQKNKNTFTFYSNGFGDQVLCKLSYYRPTINKDIELRQYVPIDFERIRKIIPNPY